MPSSTDRAALLAVPGVLVCCLLVALGMAPLAAPPSDGAGYTASGAYPDAPVVAHTGGFGEPTCQSCHFDNPLNAPGGSLEVEGWPSEAAAGERYELVVRVAHPELVRGGFQVAVRTPAGQQAGTVSAKDDRAAVTASAEGVQYAHHTLEGTPATAGGRSEWAVAWTAPPDASEAVLHVVANAANGDRSEFGDFIFADSLKTIIR